MNRVFLFHDGNRTFHPELYVVENNRSALLVIGSGNVTEGGLYTNFEASTAIDLNRRTRSDERFRSNAREYFDSFIATGMPFRRLDSALLKELRDKKLIATSAERGQVDRQRRTRTAPTLKQVFGRQAIGLLGAPTTTRKNRRPPVRAVRGVRVVKQKAALGGATARRTATSGTSRSVVAMSWWRELTVSDAMKKPPPSHQRKDVILNRGPHPIDQAVFFRQYFFHGLAWGQQMMRSYRGQSPRPKELTVVPFDVYIGRRHLGVHNLTVDHAPSREAGQGNSPTWLNWSSLGNVISRGNYVGWYLLLERLKNGTFRLTLSRSQPGHPVVPSSCTLCN